MTLPDSEEVRALARKYLMEANVKGSLHYSLIDDDLDFVCSTLTPKLLRRQIENELDLDEGTLDSSEYKDVVKEAIRITMEELGSGVANKEAQTVQKEKKRIPREGGERAKAPNKKLRVSKKEGNPGKQKVKSAQKYASPPPGVDATRTISPFEEDRHASTNPPQKRKRKAPVRVEDSSDEKSDIKDEPQTLKADSGGPDARMSESQENLSGDAKDTITQKANPESDSELSELTDDAPPKRKRKMSTDKNKTGSTKSVTKGKQKSTGNLSKDEETIKKLKSLVVACGVRKVWSKVFQELDSPAQQINKLKEILQDLGMKGRMSVEQAKAIREKREFAQELQDIQEFEKAIMKSGQKRGANTSTKERDSVEDESENEEDFKPRQRKMNAAQSINAFLGDQSSDED